MNLVVPWAAVLATVPAKTGSLICRFQIPDRRGIGVAQGVLGSDYPFLYQLTSPRHPSISLPTSGSLWT